MNHEPRRHTYRSHETGRYLKGHTCDGCNKPIADGQHFTDEEVCGVGDGPGFFLCARKRCINKRHGLTIEQRRELYTETRNARL